MGFFDRLLGREEEQPYTSAPRATAAPQRSADEIAVERYQYLLRTAPPETIEKVHTEAFSKLTPKQRDILFDQMTAQAATPSERPADAQPATLAQAATRAELQNPGTMTRTLNGGAMGPSFGSMFGSSLLGSVAGYVIASTLMSAFMPMSWGTDASATDASTDASTDNTDASADSGTDSSSDNTSTDASGADYSGADASGSDSSGFDGGGFDGGFGGGGDFGGGDFGGF